MRRIAMRRPQGPFLEISFYFAELSEADALTRLVASLIERGASFTGEGYAHLGPGLRDEPFESPTDLIQESVTIKDMAALERHLADPDVRVVEVLLENATGTAPGVAEIVTLLRISPEAAIVDKHPLVIWTDGDVFSHLLSPQERAQAQAVGEQVYRLFRALVERLEPSYAAITSEIPLECPTDLRSDPRSGAFREFFVKRVFLGARNTDRLRELFADAYIEEIAGGLYVSCYEFSNPEGNSLDSEAALFKSYEVAKLIAGARGRGTGR
jgi:hypothetical protein